MKTHLRILVLSLLALLPAAAAAGQAPVQLSHAIPAPPVGVQSGAGLGRYVGMDETYTAIGAPYDDMGAEDAGTVKVFSTGTGALLHVLPNPHPVAFAHFGRRLAISGARVVIASLSANAAGHYFWRAYVYDLGGATPTVPVATLDFLFPLIGQESPPALAISGMRVAVGLSYAAIGAPGSGIAYVYDLDSATPETPVFTLNNPTPAKADEFGTSVAIDGTRVVVGALRDATAGKAAGSAYVYDLRSATPTVPVTVLSNPNPAGNIYFGWVVEVSKDRLVVTTPFDRFGNFSDGKAYIYDLGSRTPTVPVATLTDPNEEYGKAFGWNAKISGSRVVIAALRQSSGQGYGGNVYVYDFTNGMTALPLATFGNPDPENAQGYAISVAISGTRVVVGAYLDNTAGYDAGSTYVYDLTSGNPTVPALTLIHTGPSQRDRFGYSVAISGSLMVVGAPSDDSIGTRSGLAYVFDLGGATPSVPFLILDYPGRVEGAAFGSAVAVSGKRIVVGAPRDGAGYFGSGRAYVFDLGSATPTVPTLTLDNPNRRGSDSFGFSVAISGSHVVVGVPKDDTSASNAGRAYVYDLGGVRPAKPVARLNNPNPARNDRFGWSVAVTDLHVVVGTPFADSGAPNAGCAYVYNLTGATPASPSLTLFNPRPGVNDHFGHSVSISGPGVVIGVPNDDQGALNAGSAYVYNLAGLRPTLPVAFLTNPSPALNDNFGYSVAVSNSRIVVGAYRDDTAGTNAGTAYLFDTNSTSPLLPIATLKKPSPAALDHLGRAVAIDGATIVVGTPNDDTTMLDKGAVYVFEP